ncbi:MAG: hypothetical protein AB1765_11310 [Candidatus Hydrogenedentota bacterium]
MRMLIYRRGGIGDVLLLVPVIANLKKDDSCIIDGWGGSSVFLYLKQKNIINNFYYEESIINQKYDRGYLFTEQSTILSKAREICSDVKVIPPLPQSGYKNHILDYYSEELGIAIDKEKAYLENVPASCDGRVPMGCSGFMVIHPGSGSKNKVVSPEYIFNFLKEQKIDKLKKEIIFGPWDVQIAEEWLPYKTKYFNTLIEVEKILLKSELYIGMDSGISHLAGLLGIKGYVFFKNSDPFIWRPVGKNLIVLKVQ